MSTTCQRRAVWRRLNKQTPNYKKRKQYGNIIPPTEKKAKKGK